MIDSGSDPISNSYKRHQLSVIQTLGEAKITSSRVSKSNSRGQLLTSKVAASSLHANHGVFDCRRMKYRRRIKLSSLDKTPIIR